MSAQKKAARGQTLIGILVAIAILSILSQAIFTVVNTSFRFVSFNRARITGRHLAQEKIELIRNLPFDDVGTQGGIPEGPLPQQENIVRNKLNYVVKTAIIYVDDPFDNTAPSDLLPTDYKRVRVDVSWDGIAASKNNPVVLITDVAPKGIETTTGGGTLSLLVFDANGNPVPQANITIVAVSLGVNIASQTGDNGRLIFPGAPTCISCYQITATKPGFSTERTYSTAEVANPNKPYQTVIQGQLTEISFAIDRISTLNLTSRDTRENSFVILPNVNFKLRGEKTIGTNSSSQPVYKYDEALSTGASGTLTVNDLEWDNYQVIMPASPSYDISGANPLLPIILLPNTTLNFDFALSSHTAHSLLVTFVDNNSIPVASVSARLTDGGSYDQTILSGDPGNPDYGQVFFPSLSTNPYQLEATASGFSNYSGSVNVTGQTQETVILTP